MTDILTAGDRARLRAQQEANFPDLCEIHRNFPGTDGQGGQTQVRRQISVSVPCRLAIQGGSKSTMEADVTEGRREMRDLNLTVAWDQDLEAADRVTVNGQFYEVLGIQPHSFQTAKRATVAILR